uniref:Uncharacterized protein n=1 Tax=Tanacetum cinerariifolium TaxID=118510 RepID=A0A6L2NYZ7_TANCI|nr:hypothetical protein [Tanacetum cinerariifolium]
MVSFIKLSILKKGEYILWTMKMEQYLAHTDYALWEVILNGNSAVQTIKDKADNEVEVPPVTAHQILARTTERKAKSTLLMVIPDEHLTRFHRIKDAKTLWAAIKTKFGDKGYDRFQRLVSLLEIHGAGVSTEDANQKFIRSLPSAWSNISLIIRNKPGIDNLNIDDMYNNLKVYEADIKGSSGSSSNSQNVAFIFIESISSTNELNAAYRVSTTTCHSSHVQGSSSYADELMFSFFANQSSSPQLDNEDLEQIDQDNLEEMDLKWQVGCSNFHRKGHFAMDYKTTSNSGNKSRDAGNAGYRGRDNAKRSAKKEDKKALVVQDRLGLGEYSFGGACEKSTIIHLKIDTMISDLYVEDDDSVFNQFNEKEVLDVKEEEVTETVFDNYSSDEENSLANDRFKKGEGYDAVPPPLNGNYMPPKSDLSFTRLDDSIYKFKISETITSLTTDEKHAPKTSTACVEKPKEDRSADESVKHVKPINYIKPVKPVKSAEQTKKSKNFSSSPKADREYWNGKMTQKLGLGFGFSKKACFVCGSISHLIKDCTFHEDRMAKKYWLHDNVGKGTGHKKSRLVWNNIQRINHQNKFAPTTVFTRFGRIPVSAAQLKVTASTSAAKPVNTVGPTQSVHFSKSKTHSRRNSTERVNAVGSKAVSAVKGNGVTAVKTSTGSSTGSFKEQKIVNNGCSRHTTGNKAYLVDYQEINDGGFVAFGSSRGKITDKVLLRIPRQSNMYSFVLQNVVPSGDLTYLFAKASINESNLWHRRLGHNVVPSGDLTYLFAKASIDESNLWHRRLGHVNFKTMIKLVKGNLVRGIPSKIVENDHTYVACQKGKQHKATCKAEAVNTACYVLNKNLVTKFQNKTPYELLNGRTPRLDFLRPFGCPITILNTLDPLGKFEGKAYEGFLVGYSLSSKAFGVFNTKTRKVEKNLHVRFHENKLNVAGTGPNWLFDIDSLTNSMHYIPVSAGNQTDKNAGPQYNNGNVGTQDNVDVGKEEPDQHYIVLPLWSSISSTFKILDDTAADDKPKDDTGSKIVEEPINKEDQAYKDELDKLMGQEKEASDASNALRKEFELGCMDQRGATKAGSTNSFNTVSNPVNAASTLGTFSAGRPSSSHPDAFSPANTLLHMEPKKVAQALDDKSWVEAMQEELLQFSLQKVWRLVDLPYEKKAIGTKWV